MSVSSGYYKLFTDAYVNSIDAHGISLIVFCWLTHPAQITLMPRHQQWWQMAPGW
jgi:hypothetical protein